MGLSVDSKELYHNLFIVSNNALKAENVPLADEKLLLLNPWSYVYSL